MKKLISLVAISAILGLSGLQAKANVDSIESSLNTKKIQKADAEFLFNNADSNNVIVLSNDELDNTKGEFWWFFVIPLIPTIIGYGFSCGLDKQCGIDSVEVEFDTPTINF